VNARNWIIAIIAAIIIVGGIVIFGGQKQEAPPQQASTTEQTQPSTTTEQTQTTQPSTTTTEQTGQAATGTTTETQQAAAPAPAGALGAMAGKDVKIATEGAYPPFNFVDTGGKLQGFDVDIANALCEKMQAKCEVVAQAWDGIIPGLLEKKYDAIVASMSITEERKQKVDFTGKYYQTPAKFVAKKGAGLDISKDGLKGKTIGVQVSTIHENFVRDNFGDVATIKTYDTQENANLDLAAGRLDAILADSVALDEGFLKTDAGKDFEFVGPDFTDKKWFGEGAGIAVRKDDPQLRDALNAAIDAIRQDGTYKKLNDKYFKFDIYGTPGS
jgi:arginine/ornithine transport system substrate-binding protein